MAKLKAPLMSLGAAGALGKALVFFGWKGLDVVREYVIPSNPQTTLQQTQRAYMTLAVEIIHELQAAATWPITARDIAAYALWGSTYPTPRTWFNQCVKNAIDQYKDGLNALYNRDLTSTPANNQITVKCMPACRPVACTNAEVWWGTSKTALINSQAVTLVQLNAGIAITGMPRTTKIYFQIRPTLPVGCIGNRSGIYYDYTT